MDTVEPKIDPMDKIWEGDHLDRRQDAGFLRTFLVRRVLERKERGETASYVLNLDARWGQGKTFFLDRLKQQLEQEGFIVAKVNAWRDDHTDDPLIAVMAAVDEALKPHIKSKKSASIYRSVKENAGSVALAVGKGIAKTLVQKYVGSTVDEIISGISTEEDSALEGAVSAAASSAAKEIESISNKFTDQFIKSFNEESSAIEKFKSNISTVIEAVSEDSGKADLLFILVDELDRCRPTYAIKLLERVKHMFETDNVVFIIATDTSQLKHSIKATYGTDFDGQGYLLRFFDSRYELISDDRTKIIKSLWYRIIESKLYAPTKSKIATVIDISEAYELTAREIIKSIELLENLISIWESELLIELTTAYIFIVDQVNNGVCGTNTELFREIISNKKQIKSKEKKYNHSYKKDVNLNLDEYIRKMYDNFEIIKLNRSDETDSGRYISTVLRQEGTDYMDSRDTVPSIQANIPILIRAAARITKN